MATPVRFELTRETPMNFQSTGLEPWQVKVYTFALTSVVLWLQAVLFRNDESLCRRASKMVILWLRRVLWMLRKMECELAKARVHIDCTIHRADAIRKFYKFLPDLGLSQDEILSEANVYEALGNYEYSGGMVSGTVHSGDPALLDLLTKIFQTFVCTNPLHPDVSPGIRKMEAKIVRMVCNMFLGPPESCGTVTSGGTKSILLACLAYRNRAYSLGIYQPEMVIPIMAHGAFDKVAGMFHIKVRHVALDRNLSSTTSFKA